MTKSESHRFAADARMGIIEQAVTDVQQLASWKQTVDNALGTFVLKIDAHEAGRRIGVLEAAARERGGGKGGEKGGWQMTRPKDLIPDVLKSSTEWNGWKDSVEDYADKIRPGLKRLMKAIGKSKQVIDEAQVRTLGHGSEEWQENASLYELLKLKTSPGTEARTIVTNAEKEGGFEAWRNLSIMYEPTRHSPHERNCGIISATE